MAVRFDAAADYLQRTSDLLSYNSAYTVAGWVYFTDLDGGTSWYTVCVLHDGTASFDDLWVEAVSDNWHLNVNGSDDNTAVSVISLSTWYHYALVREDSSTLKLYINGTLVLTNSTAIGARSANNAFSLGNFPGFGDWMDGRQAAVKAWSAALTLAEVQQEIYTIRPQRTANLYGWWPVFPGATERDNDYSGNGRDWTQAGTLTDEGPPPVSWGAGPYLIQQGAGGTASPSGSPSGSPSHSPSHSVSASPSEGTPSASPSEGTPSASPSEGTPSASPSKTPSASPSEGTPSASPSEGTPSASPSEGTPSASPSEGTPSASPSHTPSASPSEGTPSASPSHTPSASPSEGTPSASPSEGTPSASPSEGTPSASPSEGTPSASPSHSVSASPSEGTPSASPSEGTPSASPSHTPSASPSEGTPSASPSFSPSASPSEGTPSASPSEGTPSASPSEGTPSASPSEGTPSASPSEGTPSASPSHSVSASPSEGTPSASPSEGTPSASPSATPSASPSEGTPSASPSASGEPPEVCPVCWGHVTGVTETVLTFAGNWAGTGAIAGVGDAEVIELNAGEYMISEVVDTGSTTVTLEQNFYDPTGDDVDMDYRHGATEAACLGAAWNNYVAPFASLGYIQVRLTSTL